MMIQRVRLQRKFTLRSTIDPKERAAQIAQMMVLFELIFISLSALLSFSPHFHLQHLFTTEFWTVESVSNSNLALAICIFLLLPYLIIWMQVPGSSVKDFVATALTLHFIFSVVINFKLTLGYTLFMVLLGVIGGALGSYGAILREQKKLIDEIKLIQGEDRRQHRLSSDDFEKACLHEPDN